MLADNCLNCVFMRFTTFDNTVVRAVFWAVLSEVSLDLRNICQVPYSRLNLLFVNIENIRGDPLPARAA